MAGLNETPSADRIRIAFFGLRNAGKSTLVNAFAGQDVAIVSDVAGTTTDPVSKAMEILPLGPCLITDTAGLDDVGELGAMRVEKTLRVLATTDIAVWVHGDAEGEGEGEEARFMDECRRRGVAVIEYRRGDNVEELRRKVAAVKVAEMQRPVVADLVGKGDVVLLVCPQDGSAPKGRLILPQQQVIREILDAGGIAQVCQPEAISTLFCSQGTNYQLPCRFAITDSQAFGAVDAALPPEMPLTSFSILFARAKGDLKAFCEGLEALKALEDGNVVLVAEGCTHHRQCGDIGTVKLPKAVAKLTGKRLDFRFCSGGDFPVAAVRPKLVIHCGGCMLARREMSRRMELAREAGVPVTNYGLVLAAANGIEADPVTCMVRRKAR
jgi:small GTP-binding protein